MRERAMIANGRGHPAQPYEAKRSEQHAPAGQRKQDQAGHRSDVDQDEPREHQRVFVARSPPWPLPRRVYRALEGSCAIQLNGPENAAEVGVTTYREAADLRVAANWRVAGGGVDNFDEHRATPPWAVGPETREQETKGAEEG